MKTVHPSKILAALVPFMFCAAPMTRGETNNAATAANAADMIFKLCLGGGQKVTISGGASGGASLSLKGMDAAGNIKGDFRITKSEAQGLVNGLDSKLDSVTAQQASQVRECIRPFRDRIMDLILPPARSGGDVSSGSRKATKHLTRLIAYDKYSPVIKWPLAPFPPMDGTAVGSGKLDAFVAVKDKAILKGYSVVISNVGTDTISIRPTSLILKIDSGPRMNVQMDSRATIVAQTRNAKWTVSIPEVQLTPQNQFITAEFTFQYDTIPATGMRTSFRKVLFTLGKWDNLLGPFAEGTENNITDQWER